MTDYTEKRSYRRVQVECAIYYKMLDTEIEEEEVGQLENISGRGLMFIAEMGVPMNSELEIRVEPGVLDFLDVVGHYSRSTSWIRSLASSSEPPS